MLITGAIAAAVVGLTLLVAQLPDSTAGAYLDLAGGLAVAFVPLGFLVGLVRGRFAQVAVGNLVIELGRTMAPGELRGAMARALGDPSLQVAYRLPDIVTVTWTRMAGRWTSRCRGRLGR